MAVASKNKRHVGFRISIYKLAHINFAMSITNFDRIDKLGQYNFVGLLRPKTTNVIFLLSANRLFMSNEYCPYSNISENPTEG